MITVNNVFKCDFCGRFITTEDLQNNKASHSLIVPDSNFSIEEWETTCKKCKHKDKDIEKCCIIL
jgi:hypothetical protein